MKSILEETKAVICKFQENMARYYNRYYMSTSVFNTGNKIYLDFTDIHTICSLAKLA